MISAAMAMVKCLEKEGIKTVFGYPGAAICPFYDALTTSNIRHILVRQEQNGGHAANGYARISGKPAVCIATSGPGATNLITAIATAYMDSIPLVVITGQVNSDLLGRDVFQEADITGSAEPFVKHSYLVKNAADIPRIFKEAFYIAGSGRPGPVLIDIPMDVQKVQIDFDYPKSVDIRSYKPSSKGHPVQIKKVVAAVSEAQKPLICIGGGVFASHAENKLLSLAEKCDIPMVSTMMGISAVPANHPLYFGMIGMHGKKVANTALLDADLLILIGARVGDRAVSTPGILEKRTKIIHIDIDPAEIGKNMEATIPLVGDADLILQQILDKIASNKHTAWVDSLTKTKSAISTDFSERKATVNPKAFIRLLSDKLPTDAVLVADVGQNQIWSANFFSVEHGRFLTSGGMGTMGYSVPAAMGAKLADPEKEVVAVCGDGSFQMQFMELATLCQHDIPIKVIVMKNGRLGMVRELQTKGYQDNQTAVFLDGSPDFPTLASAYGIPARSISFLSEADAAIDEMLACHTPYLLECIVDPDESSL
ncbi:MAG: biosynthetic-type acetolactate synthase large subunit [Clostridiales bacterium]|nr:biosynthetic-type acetolactate synthase large subunit [Clostridiales bacterium]